MNFKERIYSRMRGQPFFHTYERNNKQTKLECETLKCRMRAFLIEIDFQVF